MAEAGGPAVAEMQAQKPAMRLQDRLDKWARETFTYQGRVDRQVQDNLRKLEPVREQLDKLPAEQRQALMDQMYVKSRDAATKSIVRDVAVIAGAAGAAGIAYWQRDRLGNAIFSVGIPKREGGRRSQGARETLVRMRKAHFDEALRTATDPVRRFVDWMVTNTAGRLAGNFGWRRDAPPTATGPT